MSNLTDEQCEEFRRLPGSFNNMVRAIYAAGVASMQGEQEPVAIVERKEVHGSTCVFINRMPSHRDIPDGALLYTAPQPNAAIEQEPVAWKVGNYLALTLDDATVEQELFPEFPIIPLYATPQPIAAIEQEPVAWLATAYEGFVELRGLLKVPGYCAGPKFTEKQAFEMVVTKMPQGEQEPYAYDIPTDEDGTELAYASWFHKDWHVLPAGSVPLYAAPQPQPQGEQCPSDELKSAVQMVCNMLERDGKPARFEAAGCLRRAVYGDDAAQPKEPT